MGRTASDKTAIVDFIKNSDHPVTSKEIVANTGYSGDPKYLMKFLVKNYKEIERVGEKSKSAYIWKSSKPVEVVSMKVTNGGKYPMRQHIGEVWSFDLENIDNQSRRDNLKYQIENNNLEGLLIISAKENVCIGYNVFSEKKKFMKPDYIMRWTNDSGTHYVSVIHPINIEESDLNDAIYELNEQEKSCLRLSVLVALGIDLPEPEKEVEFVQDPSLVNENKKLRDRLNSSVMEIKDLRETNKGLAEHLAVLESQPKVDIIYRTDPKEIETAVLKAKCEVYERLVEVWMKK